MEASPGNWHEKAFVVEVFGRDMPVERKVNSNPDQCMDLLIYKYTKKMTPCRKPRRSRKCDPKRIQFSMTIKAGIVHEG